MTGWHELAFFAASALCLAGALLSLVSPSRSKVATVVAGLGVASVLVLFRASAVGGLVFALVCVVTMCNPMVPQYSAPKCTGTPWFQFLRVRIAGAVSIAILGYVCLSFMARQIAQSGKDLHAVNRFGGPETLAVDLSGENVLAVAVCICAVTCGYRFTRTSCEVRD